MDDFDSFIRKNAPAVPPAKFGEAERIWRAIESRQRPTLSWWKVAVPVGAIIAIVLTLWARMPNAREREIDQVLMAAVAYEAQDDGDGFP